MTLTIILFSACFAWYMTNVIRWQDYHDYFYNSKPFNFKPLNCTTCLSGWTGLIVAGLEGHGLESIFFLFICAVAGVILDSLMQRL